jgi:hypothetical protein
MGSPAGDGGVFFLSPLFGHDEISQWQAARTHRLQLKTAGFSDQEIDAYLARAPKALAAAR